jgi:tight adherence protein B
MKKYIDYRQYKMNITEKTLYMFLASFLLFCLGFLFFRDIKISLLLCPLSIFYPAIRQKEIIVRKQEELCIQFKDLLYALSSSLSAGRSVEMAFRYSVSELSLIYPETSTPIVSETILICRKLDMNESIETALSEFAERSGIEDIINFADIFRTCNRSGGNLVEVVRNAVNIINDKLEVKQEIAVMLSQRKFEHKILSVMPAAIMLLISITAGDYLKPVFSMPAGHIVSFAALLLYLTAYIISKRIMEINL